MHASEFTVIRTWVRNNLIQNKFGGRNPKTNAVLAGTVTTWGDLQSDHIRIHIHALDELMLHLKANGFKDENFKYTKVRVSKGDTIDLSFNEGVTLRDYQEEAIEVAMSNSKYPATLLGLYTGAGKTFTALALSTLMKTRTAIILRPCYIKQWMKEITSVTNTTEEEIYHVSGKLSLIKLMKLAQEDEHQHLKYIIFSNATYRVYLKLFMNNKLKEKGYIITPGKLMEMLGIGLVEIDEVHSDLHFWYFFMLHTKVARIIALSATFLDDGDEFIRRVQSHMFPRDTSRYDYMLKHPYIDYTSIKINLAHKRNFSYHPRFNSMYSHKVVEKSLLSVNARRDNFFTLIRKLVDSTYISRRAEGDKCLIFVASLPMAEELSEYLMETYPNDNVVKYVGGVDLDVLLGSDIAIATAQVASTGLDIKGLLSCISVNSVKSALAVIQALGRLRNLKRGKGREETFIQIDYSNIIPKQDYQTKRDRDLIGRVRSNRRLVYNTPI